MSYITKLHSGIYAHKWKSIHWSIQSLAATLNVKHPDGNKNCTHFCGVFFLSTPPFFCKASLIYQYPVKSCLIWGDHQSLHVHLELTVNMTPSYQQTTRTLTFSSRGCLIIWFQELLSLTRLKAWMINHMPNSVGWNDLYIPMRWWLCHQSWGMDK